MRAVLLALLTALLMGCGKGTSTTSTPPDPAPKKTPPAPGPKSDRVEVTGTVDVVGFTNGDERPALHLRTSEGLTVECLFATAGFKFGQTKVGDKVTVRGTERARTQFTVHLEDCEFVGR